MAELTPLGIAVLALLNEKSMHAYEMYQLLLKYHRDLLVKVRPGSLYHTVERLAGQQLVEATGTDRSGNRPERTTYAITPAGQAALVGRIQDALEKPADEFPIFPVALSEAYNLPREDAVARLRRRVVDLEGRIDEMTELIRHAHDFEVEEVYWFVADYLRSQAGAERDWLQTTIDRIESKDLPWPHPKNQ
jgi:DNA-binding PadR family transcriptional regulator